MDARFLIPLLFFQFVTTSAQSDPPKINDFLFSGGFEFIDLSHSFDNGTIYWPGARKFEFTSKVATHSPRNGGWYVKSLTYLLTSCANFGNFYFI